MSGTRLLYYILYWHKNKCFFTVYVVGDGIRGWWESKSLMTQVVRVESHDLGGETRVMRVPISFSFHCRYILNTAYSLHHSLFPLHTLHCYLYMCVYNMEMGNGKLTVDKKSILCILLYNFSSTDPFYNTFVEHHLYGIGRLLVVGIMYSSLNCPYIQKVKSCRIREIIYKYIWKLEQIYGPLTPHSYYNVHNNWCGFPLF
jgi:hypothetical protein